MKLSASLRRKSGHDEERLALVELDEPVLERGQAKEPVLLRLELERDLVDRARVARAQLALGLEVRAAGAVPAFVRPLVDVPGVVDALDHLGHAIRVARIRRADEEVVRSVDGLRHRLEARRVAVGQLLGADPLLLRRELHRLAVLVRAREEEDILPALAHVAREDVGRDRRVRVAQVRLRVDVEDRGGDVEGHAPSICRQKKGRPGGRPFQNLPVALSSDRILDPVTEWDQQPSRSSTSA